MAHLSLKFLGGFDVMLDAQPVTTFGAGKARALLAFLAIESSRSHQRAKLAAMFWPDLPEKKAAHNLSQSLLRIRKALQEKERPDSPPFLIVSAQDIQFNQASDYKLDVERFYGLLNLADQHQHPKTESCEVCVQWLSQVAELYRGQLLTGLFVPDSVVFEEWRLVQQEELHRKALETLSLLANYHEQRGEHERVQDYALRQITLEPWRDEAHLQLMRALVQSGQASVALRQYELYRHTLDEELAIKPSRQVTEFYEQIRAGDTASQIGAKPRMGEAVWLSSQGERRQVTTLVCGWGGGNDPEEQKEQLAYCEQHCGAIFNRFGGRRALRQGETCLVYFGYPQAYEDAARRAVHSALELASVAKNDEAVRIGIHTGVMMVGEKKGRRWQDRDLVGTAVEIARECQRLAKPGEILVTENTRHLVQDSFEFQTVSVQRPKAPDKSMSVYQVRRNSSAKSRLEWLAQTQRLTSFVGRKEEFTKFKAGYERLFQGEGQVILLSGEPGIGKSRLVWELKENISTPLTAPPTEKSNRLPLLWLESRCLPHYQNTSLYPLIKLLEGMLEFQAQDSFDIRREKLTRSLAEHKFDHPSAVWLLSLLLGLPTEVPAPDTITKAQREQTREIFLALLQKYSTKQPLVLVIDDLHWSDPSTVEWLGQSINSLVAAPCLVLLTARPNFNPEWLGDERLRSNLLQLNLKQLDLEEAEQMVTDLAGENNLDVKIRHKIVTQTDGIPLFIEELTKALLEGPVHGDEKSRKTEVPATLLDSLVARLDRLGAAKETAQWAAVLGREFSYPILRSCLPYDEGRLQSDLARLIEAELVAPVQGTAQARYIFRHTLVQETAYASMLKRTRRAYHGHIAETLEARFPQIAENRPEILAQHYSSAGRRDKAVDCWLRAGERATAQGATREAKIFYDHALEEIELGDNERRWRALEGRERVFDLRGERGAQKADIDALLELAESLGDDKRRAQAQVCVSRYATSQSDYRGQLEAAEAAITAANRVNSLTVEVEALAYKVTALLRLGERAALHRVVEQTLAQVRKVSDNNIKAYAMAAVALYYVEEGDLFSAAQCLEQSLDAAKYSSVRRLDLEAQYYGHLGFTYVQLGLYSQALEALKTGLELADLMGLGRYRAYHKLNLGFVHWRLGDFETAIQMEVEVLEEYSATGEVFGQAAAHAYLGYIYEEAAKLDLASEHLAKARAGFTEISANPDKFEAQAVEARVILSQGRREDAQKMALDVWKYLCEQGTEGLGSPAWVYACVADVLSSVENMNISIHEVIEAGYRDLMQRAEKINDPEWRKSFLENVVENKAIVERWKNLDRLSVD